MRAGVYTRISDDRLGESAGVTRQDADCHALAARLGWTVTETYTENDTSAFRRRVLTLPDGTRGPRVIRPEFRRLLADLTAGRIDAVIGYDLDRVARDPRDLEDLIDVCESTGRPARSVTGSLDLSSDAGVTMARVAVAMANQASRDTSRRVRRAKEDAVRKGRWSGGGRRAYGYTPTRDAAVPAEAQVVRDVVDRVLAGESLRAIVADLNAQGVPAASGGRWTMTSIRGVLTRPAIAGRLTFHGQDAGEAPWPAIVHHETWQHVQDALSSRSPRRTGQLSGWLSGVLACGRCGHPLRVLLVDYRCDPGIGGCGGLTVRRKQTEAHMAEAIFRRVEARPVPVVTRRTLAGPADDDMAQLAAMWGAREIGLAEYRAARKAITDRLVTEQRERAVTLPAWARTGLRDAWPALNPAVQRQVATALLHGVVVHPARTRAWTPARLDPQWR